MTASATYGGASRTRAKPGPAPGASRDAATASASRTHAPDAQRGTSEANRIHAPAAVWAAEGATKEYIDATPRRPRRSDFEIEAEDELGHHWVTVLSIEKPMPRAFGDNHGMLPIWVESNADWRRSGVAFDQHQPAARTVRLAVIGCPSIEHAGLLKARLDEALHGQETATEADALRHEHRYRNGVDFGSLEEWWTPMLSDVLMRCELAVAGFETFTRAEHDAKVAALARRKEQQALTGRGR